MTEIIMLLIALALLPFAAFALARVDIFWTLLETGNIKYIQRGDTVVRIIADVEGKKVDGYKIVDGTQWEPLFGMYWIGLPPFASVKKFTIDRKREREELAGRPTAEWIEDLGKKEVNSLRYAFPRPLLLSRVELKVDRQTVDLLVVCKFIVVNAYVPVPELKGDFFELASSILRGAVIDIVKDQNTIEQFLAVTKGDGVQGSKGILNPLTEADSEVNKVLGQKTGLRLVGINIADWEPSDPATRDAMSKAFIAEKAKEATLIDAGAYAEQLTIRTTAEAASIERLGRAQGTRITAARDALAAQGASPDEVVRATARVTQADSLKNLTTLVEGNGGAVVAIPTQGDKR